MKRILCELNPGDRYYMASDDLRVDKDRKMSVNYYQEVYAYYSAKHATGVQLCCESNIDGCIVELDKWETYKISEKPLSDNDLYLPVLEVVGQQDTLMPEKYLESYQADDTKYVESMDISDNGYVNASAIYKDYYSEIYYVEKKAILFEDATENHPILIFRLEDGYQIALPNEVEVQKNYFMGSNTMILITDVIKYNDKINDQTVRQEAIGYLSDDTSSIDEEVPRVHDLYFNDGGYVNAIESSFVDRHRRLYVESGAEVVQKLDDKHTLYVYRDKLGYHARLDDDIFYPISSDDSIEEVVVIKIDYIENTLDGKVPLKQISLKNEHDSSEQADYEGSSEGDTLTDDTSTYDSDEYESDTPERTMSSLELAYHLLGKMEEKEQKGNVQEKEMVQTKDVVDNRKVPPKPQLPPGLTVPRLPLPPVPSRRQSAPVPILPTLPTLPTYSTNSTNVVVGEDHEEDKDKEKESSIIIPDEVRKFGLKKRISIVV